MSEDSFIARSLARLAIAIIGGIVLGYLAGAALSAFRADPPPPEPISSSTSEPAPNVGRALTELVPSPCECEATPPAWVESWPRSEAAADSGAVQLEPTPESTAAPEPTLPPAPPTVAPPAPPPPPPPPASGQLSLEELYALLDVVGWPGPYEEVASVACGYLNPVWPNGESTCFPAEDSGDHGASIGLLSIHCDTWCDVCGVTRESLRDAVVNLTCARYIYELYGWSPWTVQPYGGR